MVFPGRRGSVAVLGLAVVVAFACLVYPIYVIRPFRFQGARELAVALWVLRYRALVTSVCVLAAVAAVFAYWRAGAGRWKRAAMIVGAVATCVFAGFCYVNVYELMFHPNPHPAFTETAAVKLDQHEKLLVVHVKSAARAYPIRALAYHHIVNDVVAGEPIVATY